MKFTIETVSKLTGIPSTSLRNWEKRYGFPQPVRTSGGHRYYASLDVEFLKKAVQWIDQGCCLSEVAKIYHDGMNGGTDGHNGVKVESPNLLQSVVDDVSYRRELIYDSLLKFDYLLAQQHYSILNAKLSPEQLFDQVFEPLLRRLGVDWEAHRLTVAQEHYASSFLRFRLAAFMAIDFQATLPHRILVATLEGERHEGGLMLVSAHLKFLGYSVQYLGVDLPVQGLIEPVQAIRPKVVALSYINRERLEHDLPELERLGVTVVVGGQALTDREALTRLKAQYPKIYFCDRTIGSECARYVELVCLGKNH